MRKPIFVFLITLGIIVACDMAVGAISRRLIKAVPDAGINQTNSAQALFTKKADVLILGSSRANHHYVSSMFKDSLGLTCYNAGRDGHDILYASMVFHSFLERCTPKLVVVDITESMMDGSWIDHNKDMTCFYGANDAVTEIMDKEVIKGLDKIKMFSNLYRYNNTLEWIGTAYMSNWGEGDGYFPMPVSDNSMKKIVKNDLFQVDSLCLQYLDEMVKVCKEMGIKPILCASPSIVYSTRGCQVWMKQYGNQHQINTLDFTEDTTYCNHPELFYDSSHLHDKGARIFTSDFIKIIR